LINGNIDNLEKIDFYNQNPLGVVIENVKDKPLVTRNLNNQTNNVSQSFYRHSGYYMPIFYDIELFKKYSATFPEPEREVYNIFDSTFQSFSFVSGTQSLIGNYIFDTSLSLFGVMKQRILSKVNRKESILKLKNNSTYDSIYPMLDEYGYMVADFFIFKSTWDFEYHIEANKPNISSVPTLQNIYQTLYIQSIIKKYNSI
jgi:hypothetical protein